MVFKKKEPYFRYNCCTRRQIPLPKGSTHVQHQSNPPWPHCAHAETLPTRVPISGLLKISVKVNLIEMTLCESECCSSLLVYLYAKHSCLPTVSIKVLLRALDRSAIKWIISSDQTCAVDDRALQLQYSTTALVRHNYEHKKYLL